jgi:hypothetical protein
MTLLMPVAVCLFALAADLGRVQLVKTELRGGCDAAARYAATGLGDGTTWAKANAVVNTADGQAVTFAAADVETGTWDSTTAQFTSGGPRKNAVRVTARRSVTPVFAGMMGVGPTQVTVHATAKFAAIGFGLVGLNGISMGGNATASYASADGAAGRTGYGNVGSNGNITLGGSSSVDGDLYYGPGKSVSGGTVTGTKTVLTTPLSYPNGDGSPYVYNNDNGSIPSYANSGGGNNLSLNNSQSVTLPGGTYLFQNFSMTGGSSLTFTGPATVYCYGTFNMSGNTSTSGDKASNLTIVMCPNPANNNPPGSLTVGSNTSLYATVYAPQSAVNLSGSGDIYGSVLGLAVSMTGTSSIIYDLALESGAGGISLVE